MADEAIPVEGPYETHDFTVADSAFAEGTIMKLSDPRTAAASSGADVFAGIVRTEKTVDGSLNLGLYTGGTFDIKCYGVITAGSLVSLSGVNVVKLATEAEVVTGAAFGKILETAAHDEICEVKLL